MIRRSFQKSSAPLLAVVAAMASVWACSSTETAKPAAAGDPKAAAIDETLQHEKCEASMGRAEVVDANNDGKADITQVYDPKSSHEICAITDLNHDGKAEMYEYWDDAGNLRRKEFSFENTDALTAVELYKGGKLTERRLDTTGQRRVDTWDFYDESGRRIKRERDTSNSGRVDQWWTFNSDGTITIAVDKNADGQPDPENTITVTAAGTAVAPDAGTPASSTSSADGGGPPPPPPPPVLMPEDAGSPRDAGADGGKKKKKGNK